MFLRGNIWRKLVGVELVTDLLEAGIQRKPFHDLCNLGRERNRPKIACSM